MEEEMNKTKKTLNTQTKKQKTYAHAKMKN